MWAFMDKREEVDLSMKVYFKIYRSHSSLRCRNILVFIFYFSSTWGIIFALIFQMFKGFCGPYWKIILTRIVLGKLYYYPPKADDRIEARRVAFLNWLLPSELMEEKTIFKPITNSYFFLLNKQLSILSIWTAIWLVDDSECCSEHWRQNINHTSTYQGTRKVTLAFTEL